MPKNGHPRNYLNSGEVSQTRPIDVLMGQIGIDYSKLTKEEQMTLLRVFNKSSMLKHRTKAGMRGKHRR